MKLKRIVTYGLSAVVGWALLVGFIAGIAKLVSIVTEAAFSTIFTYLFLAAVGIAVLAVIGMILENFIGKE